MSADYPRDMVGYGASPPHAQWPTSSAARASAPYLMHAFRTRRN